MWDKYRLNVEQVPVALLLCGACVFITYQIMLPVKSATLQSSPPSVESVADMKQVIDCDETNLSKLWRDAERYGKVSLSTWDMRPIGDLGYSVRVSLDEDPIKVDASFKGKTREDALANAVEVLSARFKVIGDQPKEQSNG